MVWLRVDVTSAKAKSPKSVRGGSTTMSSPGGVAAQMTFANALWQEENIPLDLLLGNRRLKRVNFRGLVANNGLHETADFVVPDLSPGIDVAVINSYPSSNLAVKSDDLGHMFRYVRCQYDRYYVDLTGTFADYMKGFKHKSRYTLLKKLRIFNTASGGTTHWKEYWLPEEMAPFHSLARAISETIRQARQWQVGIPADQGFLERMRRLAEKDSVRGYVLFLGAEPISYMHCTAVHQALVSGYVGYNPKYKALSPGVVLQYLLLERLFSQNRFRVFDFGWGGGQHKQSFASDSVPCADVYYFRKTYRNYTIVKLHALLERMSSRIVTTLDTLGVKSQVKKLLAGSVCHESGAFLLVVYHAVAVC